MLGNPVRKLTLITGDMHLCICMYVTLQINTSSNLSMWVQQVPVSLRPCPLFMYCLSLSSLRSMHGDFGSSPPGGVQSPLPWWVGRTLRYITTYIHTYVCMYMVHVRTYVQTCVRIHCLKVGYCLNGQVYCWVLLAICAHTYRNDCWPTIFWPLCNGVQSLLLCVQMYVSTDTHMCHKRAPLSMFLSPGSYVSVTCALCTGLLANPSNALVCVCVHTYIHISDHALPPCPPAGQGTHNSLPWRTQVRSDPLHLQEAVRWVQSNNIVEAHCYIVTTGE